MQLIRSGATLPVVILALLAASGSWKTAIAKGLYQASLDAVHADLLHLHHNISALQSISKTNRSVILHNHLSFLSIYPAPMSLHRPLHLPQSSVSRFGCAVLVNQLEKRNSAFELSSLYHLRVSFSWSRMCLRGRDIDSKTYKRKRTDRQPSLPQKKCDG